MLQIRNDIHQPGSCVWLLGRVLQVTALLVCLSCPRCVLALSETSRQDLWHGAHSTVHIPSAAAALDSSGHVPWKQRLLSSGSASTQTAFEQALAATFNNASATDPSTTLAQFSTLLNIVVSLGRSNKPYLRYVPELHSSTVQALMSDAVLFATSSLGDSSKLLELLASISKHIHQLHAEFGYPATRRIILGCILKKRMDFKNALSPQLQAAVDKVLLQLFNIHKRSAAAKGAVQFLHISKSGGTNLCMAAEQNSCTTEGFSEKHNCLVKEFNDIPRWVTAHAHK